MLKKDIAILAELVYNNSIDYDQSVYSIKRNGRFRKVVSAMSDHPIQGLMATTMQNIKEMVDVNTIVGSPVETSDGTVIIPISKVSFGFAAGGSEFNTPEKVKSPENSNLFGGGTGAGVSIQPVAFMIVGKNQIKLMPVNQDNPIDKLVDYIPDAVDKISHAISGKKGQKEESEE